jgi:uncharacterized protein
MIRWIITIIILGIIDFYAFQAFKTISKSKATGYIYIIVSVIVLGYLFYQITYADRSGALNTKMNLAIGLFLTLYFPKLILVVVMFGEDLIRIPQGLFHYFSQNSEVKDFYFPSRRLFVSKIGVIIAAIPFSAFLYGMLKGRYNFKVLNYKMYFEDLPEAFDGYRITQISDIHIGSFDNKEKLEYAINLINEQASDTILFTGDLVNNRADEMLKWKNSFTKLKARDGMFSILGNHDYGDYTRWKTKELKDLNFQKLINIQNEIGFDLLMNESRFIEKDNQRIAIIGVENWGKGFKQKGDLKKATEIIDPNDFKILLSHDPSHWQYQVVDDEYHYHLTLSGHTHGMQFGIEIPGLIKWSPVKWRYKYWAGIYEKNKQFINVNRGFGVLAYPGRIGIWPEITVIELKKGQQPS